MSDKPCFIYAICYIVDGEMCGPVKIGVSAAPVARTRELQTGSPHRLMLAFCAMLDSRERAVRLERFLHDDLAEFAMSGEWFDVEPGFAVGTVAGAFIYEHGGRISVTDEGRSALQ